MPEAEELEFDRAVLGVEIDVGEMTVGEEHILAFCSAVGETNPLYTDPKAAASGPYGGLTAPPIFYSVVPVQQGLDPKVTFGTTTMNAGQHCDFGEPIRPGDTVKARSAVTDVFEKTGRSGRMVFIVRTTTYTNQSGVTNAVVKQSMVRRNVG